MAAAAAVGATTAAPGEKSIREEIESRPFNAFAFISLRRRVPGSIIRLIPDSDLFCRPRVAANDDEF